MIQKYEQHLALNALLLSRNHISGFISCTIGSFAFIFRCLTTLEIDHAAPKIGRQLQKFIFVFCVLFWGSIHSQHRSGVWPSGKIWYVCTRIPGRHEFFYLTSVGSVQRKRRKVQVEPAVAPQEDYIKSVREQISTARKRRDEKCLRGIFQGLHPSADTITKRSLIKGLTQLNVGPRNGETDDDIFLQYDKNHDGRIDFDEFRTAALRLSPLEEWCKKIPWWQALADAIPRGGGEIQPLRAVADLTVAQIATICAEAETLIRQELILQVKQLRDGFAAVDSRSQSGGSAQPKFNTFKANVGTCEDYHDGLRGRVGTTRFPFRWVLALIQRHAKQGRLNPNSCKRWSLSTAQSTVTTSSSPHQTTSSRPHLRKSGPLSC
jgi:hypothetical protein